MVEFYNARRLCKPLLNNEIKNEFVTFKKLF